MSEQLILEDINELTPAQETASWDRKRTSEELHDFVEHHLGRLATAEDFELVA